MTKLINKFKSLHEVNFEKKMKKRGYWKGTETMNIRLWWNDDDNMVVEERRGVCDLWSGCQ
jgi:hypothetical protein